MGWQLVSDVVSGRSESTLKARLGYLERYFAWCSDHRLPWVPLTVSATWKWMQARAALFEEEGNRETRKELERRVKILEEENRNLCRRTDELGLAQRKKARQTLKWSKCSKKPAAAAQDDFLGGRCVQAWLLRGRMTPAGCSDGPAAFHQAASQRRAARGRALAPAPPIDKQLLDKRSRILAGSLARSGLSLPCAGSRATSRGTGSGKIGKSEMTRT